VFGQTFLDLNLLHRGSDVVPQALEARARPLALSVY